MTVVLATSAIVAVSLSIYLGLNRVADAILYLAEIIDEHQLTQDTPDNIF
jgi:hypothetical protein